MPASHLMPGFHLGQLRLFVVRAFIRQRATWMKFAAGWQLDEIWRRTGDRWTGEKAGAGSAVELTSIGCRLEVKALYRD